MHAKKSKLQFTFMSIVLFTILVFPVNSWCNFSSPLIKLGYSCGVMTEHTDDGTTNLAFALTIRDEDGVSRDSHTVTVLYPDGVTEKSLGYDYFMNWSAFSHAEAIFTFRDSSSPLTPGRYRFTVTDGDNNSVMIDDYLVSDPLGNLPTFISEPTWDDDNKPTFTWGTVLGASTYQIRIMIPSSDQSIAPGRIVYRGFSGTTQHTVPEGVLAPGCAYSFYVTAFRENIFSVGYFGTSNWSSSETVSFTTPGASETYKLSDLRVQHIVREVTPPYSTSYNRIEFWLTTTGTGDGEYPPYDIVKSVTLTGPDGEVLVSHLEYWNDIAWGGDLIDAPIPETETFSDWIGYSAVVQADLVAGTYTLEVFDAWGNGSTYTFEFDGETDLPIIDSSSINAEMNSLGDLVCTWASPTGLPDGADLSAWLTGLDQTWSWAAGATRSIFVRLPANADSVTIPDVIITKMLGDGMKHFDLNLRVHSADDTNRSYTQHVNIDYAIPAETSDSDGDGICDSVDPLLEEKSCAFSDGTTSGEITNCQLDGDPRVFIADALNETEGVMIKGLYESTFTFCDESTDWTLTGGDVIILTCGSVKARVISGEVEAEFKSDDTVTATAVINEGSALNFEPETFTFDTPETNIEPVEVNFIIDEETTATASLVPSSGVQFEPVTDTFTVPASSTEPVTVAIGENVVQVEAGATKKIVEVDIKPCSDNNRFHHNGHGVVPVAIFGSETLSVDDISLESLRLQGLSVKVVGRHKKYLARSEDIDGDGYNDLNLKFKDSDEWIEPENGKAKLTGTMADGTQIEGSDTIVLVP